MQERVEILLVASCWVSHDGLASHAGESRNTPSPFMLGRVEILLVTSCWVSCDGLASHAGESRNTPSRFMLQKQG